MQSSMDGGKSSLSEKETEDVLNIKDWLHQQPHLPHNVPDEQIVTFLHSCYFNLERTKKTIDCYYTMKTNTPEFFSDRLLINPGLKQITQIIQICMLPKKTKEGYSVICARLKRYEASKLNLDDSIKLLFLVVDVSLRIHFRTKGMVFIFDNTGVTLSHLARVNLSSVRKYFAYIQDAMPVRLKSIHILNVNPVMPHILNLIRPFIRKEHMKLIYLHTSEKQKDIFNMVSEEILPEDYGGKETSMDKLTNETLNNIREHENWFRFDETLRIDESKLNSTGSPGFTGSFKQLSID